MEKRAETSVPIHDLLARRWSPRAYDAARAVAAGDLAALLEAARWAPSSSNEQPWRFLVFDERDPAARERARDTLTAGNAWAKKAPVLVLTVAQEAWTRNGQPNPHAKHDVGLATENLLLEATARNLVVHPMAGFDGAKARELFAIPEGFSPVAMISVGHPGSADELDEKNRGREGAPRSRKPLAEIAFAGTWAKPFMRS